MNRIRSILNMVDVQCLAAAGLFLFANILDFALYFSFQNNSNFDYDKMISLDADAIIDSWMYRKSVSTLTCFTGLVTAVAWFMLIVPTVKVAWIQSAKGSYRIGLHVMIVCLVISGSVTEVISQLLYIGSTTGTAWIAYRFQLDDWTGSTPLTNHTSGNAGSDYYKENKVEKNDDEYYRVNEYKNADMIGWKTLEIVSAAMNSLMEWIDSAEWVHLAAMFILIFVSVRSTSQSERLRQDTQFNMKWAILGLVIGLLAVFNFTVVNVIVVRDRSFLDNIAFGISTINRLFLIPVWFTWLSFQLPAVEQSYEYSCIEFENTVLNYQAPNKGGRASASSSSAHNVDLGDSTDDIIDPRFA